MIGYRQQCSISCASAYLNYAMVTLANQCPLRPRADGQWQIGETEEKHELNSLF
jgi:hypothetical protein